MYIGRLYTVHTVYCVYWDHILGLCTVYWDPVQCTGIMYSVLGSCTVYWDHVQCTGIMYSVLGTCTVYWDHVQCTRIMYSVLGSCTVYWEHVQCTGVLYTVLVIPNHCFLWSDPFTSHGPWWQLVVSNYFHFLKLIAPICLKESKIYPCLMFTSSERLSELEGLYCFYFGTFLFRIS